jgi:hypothetical protein
MDNNLFDLMLVQQQKQELARVLESNKKSERYGLVLSEEEANNLIQSRKTSLSDTQRVEFGEGILSKIIYYFCDSQYINQDTYADTLAQLQELFYTYKNETQDELTDDELLDYMKKQFEEVCFGDLDYLSNTCLERFSRAVRSGYQNQMQSRLRDEYSLRDGDDEYGDLSEESRWDDELYKTSLEDLF